MTSPYKISIREIGDVTIVDAEGKLTLGLGSAALHEEVLKLIEAKKVKVILNLDGVTYIDNSGIGELVSSFTSVTKKGGSLVILKPTKRVVDLLHFTKLYTVFEVYQNEEIAVASFSR